MIVEMRSYTLKSRSVATVEQRFEKALPALMVVWPDQGTDYFDYSEDLC